MARRKKQNNNRVNQSQEDRNNQVKEFMKNNTGKNTSSTTGGTEKSESKDIEHIKNEFDDRELKIKEKEAELQKKAYELKKQSEEQQATQKKLSELQAKAEAGFESERKVAVEKKEQELAKLEEDHSEIIKSDITELKKKERAVLDQKKELDHQEANAKAGFIDQNKEALNELAAQKEAASTELAKLKDKIAKDHSEHAEWLRERQEKFDAQFSGEQLRLANEQADLQNGMRQLAHDQEILKIRKQSQEQWEQGIRKDVKREFDGKIKDLEGQLDQERTGRKADQDRLVEQNRELIKFRDFQRNMDDADPESIQDELNRREEKIKELKEKLRLSGNEDLYEKCEELESTVYDRQERINQLTRELEEANSEVYKIRLSVAAKHNLEKEKKVLELHNKSLDTAISQLRLQLDELIEKQHGSKVFPALSALDQNHRDSPVLHEAPGLKEFCKQIHQGLAHVEDTPLYYKEEDIRIFLAGLAMSNLHILQGMSGTGKTSLAIAFSKVVGGQYTNIPVQAGWRDKDDLIGHYNAFEKKFYEKETLQALYKAQLPKYEDCLNIILLDEMNLSRPEQYFAEFLNALELRAGEREIVLVEEEQVNAPDKLIDKRKIKVPDNVWFIGTANHDETTNEFADKTYDRSHVMELTRSDGEFNADDYESGKTYSYRSLQDEFEKASNKHRNKVKEMLEKLDNSTLSEALKDSFSVSWGNRFDRHAMQFIPVIIESGGSIEDALDHLLATKVFRRGKVTGRFDVNSSDISLVSEMLSDTWEELKLKGKPEKCQKLLEKDRKRLERGA